MGAKLTVPRKLRHSWQKLKSNQAELPLDFKLWSDVILVRHRGLNTELPGLSFGFWSLERPRYGNGRWHSSWWPWPFWWNSRHSDSRVLMVRIPKEMCLCVQLTELFNMKTESGLSWKTVHYFIILLQISTSLQYASVTLLDVMPPIRYKPSRHRYWNIFTTTS